MTRPKFWVRAGRTSFDDAHWVASPFDLESMAELAADRLFLHGYPSLVMRDDGEIRYVRCQERDALATLGRAMMHNRHLFPGVEFVGLVRRATSTVGASRAKEGWSA